MRGRLDDLAELQAIVDRPDDEWSNDQLLRHGIGYGVDGPLTEGEVEEGAQEALDALPLCVEATTTYEIVLGTGGPDDRLLVECDRVEMNSEYVLQHQRAYTYEIRRILYRYSWSGSAEVELVGEDKEVAERFARQVVPELVE